MIPIYAPDEIAAMRETGRTLWRVLEALCAAVRVGVRTGEIDALARASLRELGAEDVAPTHEERPSFPGVCAVGVNEEAAMAPPGAREVRAGDLVTIDLWARLDGWWVDASRVVVVPGGEAARRDERARLARAAEDATAACLAALRPGVRWSSVVRAAHASAQRAGAAVVPSLGGHGIGRALHEAPAAGFCEEFLAAPGGHEGAGPQDFVLRPGMVLTIEPVVAAGGPTTVVLDDGWTVAMADRSGACCQERTVAIRRAGPIVLTGPG